MKAVHEIFKVYEGQLVINIQVFNMDIIPAKQGDMLNRNIDGDYENLRIQNKHVVRKEQHIDGVINSEDKGYGCESNSDESWKQGFDDDSKDDIGDEHMTMSYSDSSMMIFLSLMIMKQVKLYQILNLSKKLTL